MIFLYKCGRSPLENIFFFKSSFYVSLFSAFINAFLWLCTIDIFVVKSVIPIPSLMYESLLFYCMKKKIWSEGTLLNFCVHTI